MKVSLSFGRYCVGGIVLVLCGCNSFHRMHGSEPAIGSLSAAPGAASVVGAAPIGTPVVGPDPATGAPATIKVTRAYDSAAGHACREYVVLAGSAEGHSGLACFADGAWQEVAPLVRSQGYASVAGLMR
jgi:hypothetical protein